MKLLKIINQSKGYVVQAEPLDSAGRGTEGVC